MWTAGQKPVQLTLLIRSWISEESLPAVGATEGCLGDLAFQTAEAPVPTWRQGERLDGLCVLGSPIGVTRGLADCPVAAQTDSGHVAGLQCMAFKVPGWITESIFSLGYP